MLCQLCMHQNVSKASERVEAMLTCGRADLVGVRTGGIQVGRRSSDEFGAGVRKELLVGGVHPAHHLHHLLVVPGHTKPEINK